MNRIPIGVYIPGNSILHRLDARAKLLCLIALTAALIYANSLPGYGIMAALTAILVALSGLKLKAACAPVKRSSPFSPSFF